jgi:aminoglycoside phosphotransferase family enzyme/predicted kinase
MPVPTRAMVRETHIGVVVLIGDRAYKHKKPVDLGFLDFRDRNNRVRCCEREVELNRRLAPDVYLGVAYLTDPGEVDGEPLVLMRRMPDERRLSTLVGQGLRLDDTVVRLARMMAAFHAHADRSPTIDREGVRDAIARRWRDSLRQVGATAPGILGAPAVTEIHCRVSDFLAGREQLFDRRVRDRRIVDGHGDLLADDIFCLDDGPRVLDCLEFDDQLRYVDGLDDVAFLAMDLEKLGAERLGGLLISSYADFAGDPAPESLQHHYIAYRAFVRVKVDCLRHAQGDDSAAARARVHAAIALRHLRAGTVRMVLVGGLPGAGKSTIAGLAADRLGAVLLSSDRLRKELSGLSPLTPHHQQYRHGLYDVEHTRSTYAELLRRAGDLLRNGESVVLDASWNDARFRAEASVVAEQCSSQLVQARCWASPELRRARLGGRDPGISDADAIIAELMLHDEDVWPDAIRVATAGSQEESLQQLMAGIDVSSGSRPGIGSIDS